MYYYYGVEDRTDAVCTFRNSRNNKQKKEKFRIPRPAGEMKRKDTARAIRHRLLPRNNTSHQQQQPAPRDNNLLKCKGKMDMMGKFLTRSNRSKTRRKTRRRWRWRCVGFHLFLSAVQFSVCFNVQNCCCGCCCWNSSRVCSSSQHKSMQICPLYPYGYITKCFIVLDTQKLKIRKLRIIG